MFVHMLWSQNFNLTKVVPAHRSDGGLTLYLADHCWKLHLTRARERWEWHSWTASISRNIAMPAAICNDFLYFKCKLYIVMIFLAFMIFLPLWLSALNHVFPTPTLRIYGRVLFVLVQFLQFPLLVLRDNRFFFGDCFKNFICFLFVSTYFLLFLEGFWYWPKPFTHSLTLIGISVTHSLTHAYFNYGGKLLSLCAGMDCVGMRHLL